MSNAESVLPEHLVDRRFKDGKRLSSDDHPALHRVTRGLAEYERRRSGDTQRLGIFGFVTDLLQMFAIGHAALEGIAIERKIFCITGQRIDIDLVLVFEYQFFHLPILALISGAVHGLGGFQREWMHISQREVTQDKAQLAGVNKVLFDLGESGRLEPAAV